MLLVGQPLAQLIKIHCAAILSRFSAVRKIDTMVRKHEGYKLVTTITHLLPSNSMNELCQLHNRSLD